MPKALNTEALARQAFLSACRADVEAVKPGNVNLDSPAHAMQAEDFIRSAEAAAEVFFQPHLTLGQRIHKAIEATRTVVQCNTNLGIVLISAPVVQALFCPIKAGLQAAVRDVLASTTVQDAVDAYAAIRLAQPGGMGTTARADVAKTPQVTLTAAMRYAKERDMLAAQYADGYPLIFSKSLPQLLALYKRWGYNSLWPVTGVYMALLAKYPDSLIARKQSVEQAEVVRQRAAGLASKILTSQKPDQFEPDLRAMDCSFKSEGINPGTTADLVVVNVFIAKLMKDLSWLDR